MFNWLFFTDTDDSVKDPDYHWPIADRNKCIYACSDEEEYEGGNEIQTTSNTQNREKGRNEEMINATIEKLTQKG